MYLAYYHFVGMNPRFANLPARVRVPADTPLGTFLFQVKVKDWNEESWPLTGDKVTYGIRPPHDDYFSIDDTGVWI